MRQRRAPRTLVVPCLALAFAGGAAAAPIHDQSDVGNSSINNSVYYFANDFTVTTTTSLTRATFWTHELTTGGVNCTDGNLGNLNSDLGWGVFQDAGGSPGAEVGSGSAASMVVTDTGFDQFGCDVFQVRFETSPPVTLAPGTYWFSVHEGAWHSGSDTSHVFWLTSATTVGAGSRFAEADFVVNPPTTWSNNLYNPDQVDHAFTLEGPNFAWDQGAYDGTDDGLDIDTYAGADDFVLTSTTSFSAIDAWIEDLVADDNGVVEGFDGELSWAIFSNVSDLPGARLADGVATAAWVQNLDFQSTEDTDTARVHLPLGRSVTLDPGTYWLGLHEGDWPGDPTSGSIRWGGTSAGAGLTSAISDPDVDAFADGGGLPDYAFQLYEEPLFSSGFERGTTCAWQPATAGTDCP